MKIRYKMSLIMICMTLITVFGTIAIIIGLFQNKVESDKAELNEALAQQVLISFGLLSDDIESYLFTNAMNESIPRTMLMEMSDAKRFSLQTQLQTICDRFDYIEALFVVDTQGYAFGNKAADGNMGRMDELMERHVLQQSHSLEWTRTQDGTVLFYRSLNNLYPYQKAGEMIAVIHMETLWSAMGISLPMEKGLVIRNRQGSPVLVSDPQLLTLAAPYDDYYVYERQTADHEWSVQSYSQKKDAFLNFNQIVITSCLFGIALVGCTAVLSLLISWSITRGIRVLVRQTHEVGQGNFDVELPVRSQDEIGLLTVHFNRMSKDLRELNQQVITGVQQRESARYELLELKYRALQSKISPHFICNILLAVNALAISGELEKVETLSAMAGKYLRTNLQNNDRKYTALQNEMNALRAYIKLYRQVFSVEFSFRIVCDPALNTAKVPVFILQPLVENALKHGTKGIGCRKQRIVVTAQSAGNRFTLCVEDNGCGMSDSLIQRILHNQQPGFGLSSVIKRLELVYGGEASIEITSQAFVSTRILLSIPTLSPTDDC